MNTRRTKRGNTNDVPGGKEAELKNSNSAAKSKETAKKLVEVDDGSSSDSSLDDYLKKADEIDLNSSFFDTHNTSELNKFATIEKEILSEVKHLSDSDSSNSDSEEEPLVKNDDQIAKSTQENAFKLINFSQLQEYNKKIEEVKACVQNYESKVSEDAGNLDISEMLALGEMKPDDDAKAKISDHNFDSDDEMEWEEIEERENAPADELKIPKDGVQITVALPTVVRKKKGIDFVAALKRRLNRIKKENQVYVHKVHLLCWIAHGNFLNSVLNNESLLGMALSLLPSEQCYPPKHADIKYLEQIVRWYGKMMKLNENTAEDNITPLEQALQLQITKKEALSKKHFVYIFIIILRSLGLQCRLVLSLQCIPLRPPSEELCSLSTKKEENPKSNKETKPAKSAGHSTPSTSKANTSINKPKKTVVAGKGKSANQETHANKDKSNTLKKAIIKNKDKEIKKSSKIEHEKPKVRSSTRSSANIKIPQVDGADDTDNPSKTNNKQPLLKNLREKSKTHAEKQSSKKINEKIDKPNLRNLKDKVDNSPKSSKKPDKLKATPEKPNLKNLKQKDESSATILKEEENVTKSQRKPNLRNLKEKVSKKPNKTETDPRKPNLKVLSNKRTSSEIQSTSNTEMSDPDFKTDINKNKSKRTKITSTEEKKHSPRKTETDSRKPNLKVLSNKRTSSEIQSTSNTEMSDPDFKTNRDKNKSKRTKTTSSEEKKQSGSTTLKKLAKKLDVRRDIINIIKGQMVEQKHATAKKLVKKHKYESDDSDYIPEPEPESVTKRRKVSGSEEDFKVNMNVKRRVKPRSEIDSRVLSTDDEDSQDAKKKKKGNDIWVEVFLESEEKWISADVIKGQVHCVSELYSRASQPVSYILAWNNNLSMKDITARYCTRWNTVTRKLRVDPAWWKETLQPFVGRKTSRDREEDEDLARQQLDQPLPTTISEYKDHPLYVLKRHLLKFQGIYPPDALTLGFVRNEPVYSRDCVYTLHSREIWVKHAKVVKLGETPYKIVKARPKYDRLSGKMITDQPLELFGVWQVEDYVPPVAENGIVPRNAFGNVELFKACMLPKGTVHLQLPGLNKVCRKLNIDCAPAVVGFDFHGGWSHPTFDGFVVCAEFKETVIAAWEEDQAETARKEQEKYEKRVYDNWRKLIKGLLIRERLKARYNFGDSSKSKKSKGPKVASKKRQIQSDEEDSE